MRQFLLIFVIFFLLIPVGVSAQEAIVIDLLQAEFWPEYDQPEMLVIYKIELSADTALPATLSLRIPAAAGEPFVLFVEGFGEPAYQRQVEGDWAALTFTAQSSIIQLEYYDPGLSKQGDQRSFTYTWSGDYAVNTFQLIAQQPFDASSFKTTPALTEQVSGVNGLSYYQGTFMGLSAGDQPTLSIEYQKPSDILSADASPQQAPATDASSPGTNDWLIVLLGIVGVGIIGYGIYSYTQGSSSRRRSRSTQQRKARSGGAQGKVFCHHCGTQARKDDKFCRECGKKLRV